MSFEPILNMTAEQAETNRRIGRCKCCRKLSKAVRFTVEQTADWTHATVDGEMTESGRPRFSQKITWEFRCSSTPTCPYSWRETESD